MAWVCVWILAGIGCLLLGFWCAGQNPKWGRSVRLDAKVEEIKYHVQNEGSGVIEENQCSVSVRLCFVWNGREYRETKEYRGLLSAPPPTQRQIQILFWPKDGRWKIWKRTRPYWLLLFPGAVFSICTGIALAVGGPKFSQLLGSFRYDDPNLVGQLFYGSLALLGILAGIAFGFFLIPYGFGPIFRPFLFKVWEAFGRLEEIQAKCIVIIFEAYDSNEGMFYPVFTYRGLEGIQYWRGPKNYKIGDYQPGAYYPIYRHRRTKRIYLRPKWVEVVNVPFAILRFVLLGGVLLIVLLTCMAMLGGVIVSL